MNNVLVSFLKDSCEFNINIDKHICLVDRADTTFIIRINICKLSMLLFTSLSKKKSKTKLSMLLIFSIKEKVSKENGKKFKEKINGLTRENIMTN
jgi:hypothetical protein